MTNPRTELTERERDVLRGLVAGRTYAAIARELRLNYYTVRYYSRRLRRLSGTANKTDLALWASRHPEVQDVQPAP